MIKQFLLSLSSIFISLITLTGCQNKSPFKYTKIAVFADNQITDTLSSGATAYSIPYLRQHLKVCKAQNVDVIMISGDLVNESNVSFYKNFDSILKEIYGSDEATYPEFVYTMGNHEWYNINENVDTHAVANFRKYSRINTNNLIKESSFSLPGQTYGKGTDYYKVINGIPFVSISSSGCNGLLNYEEQNEIKSWLQDINQLPSVKNGGPIFVSYHYPIKDLTYSFGQGAIDNSEYLDNLLKDYPQAILFTGDSHFAGANERTINQVNYTNINLGSSCYSRHVSKSVTMNGESYYNMANQKSKDSFTGDVAENYHKTPHIHIVEVDDKGNTTLNRYFSTNDENVLTKLGLTWNIPCGVTKDKFIYTKERYQNKDWALKMYQKDGLDWSNEATISASSSSEGVTVNFPDVIDHHYCEHYGVKIIGESEKTFHFVSHYYKWENQSHNYSFIIKKTDLPKGSNLSIKITAYDYFDNPSLNTLSTQITYNY